MMPRWRRPPPIKIPPHHDLPTHKRPKLEDFPKSFHGSNSSIDRLLDSIDLKSSKKYLLVFDIDGTLMQSFPNDMVFDIERAGKTPRAVIQKLDEINEKYSDKLKAVCLTARNLQDFSLIRSFNQIPIYGAFGYAKVTKEDGYQPHFEKHLQGFLDILGCGNYGSPEFGTSVLAMQYLQRFLEPFEIQPLIDYTVDPNAVCLKLRKSTIDYKDDIKGLVLDVLRKTPTTVGLEPDEHWTCTESVDGSYLIFNNGKIAFDKANGMKFILDEEKIDKDTTVIIFGDSGTDLKAMQEAKRKLGKDRAINVAVGTQLAKDKDVDFIFRDHIDTRRFVGRLADRLVA